MSYSRKVVRPIQLRLMVRPHLIAMSVLLVLLAACVRNQPLTGRGGLRAVSEVEIRKSDADDVLELIQKIRPSWLMGGMLDDPSDPWEASGTQVLINDLPPRPLFTLQFMPLKNVREIHYLTRTSAETRYRVGAPNGLILVVTYPTVGPGDSIRPDTGGARRLKNTSSRPNESFLPLILEAHDD
jgi:hypothetical protein